MRTNMQSKVLDALCERVEELKVVEVVIDTEYANTGRLIVTGRNSLDVFCTVAYTFEAGVCTFRFMPLGQETLEFVPANREHYIRGIYNKPGSLEAAVDLVVDLVRQAVGSRGSTEQLVVGQCPECLGINRHYDHCSKAPLWRS